MRKNRDKERGGGVGIMLKSTINHKQIPVKTFSSFEHTMISVKLSNGDYLYLICIYRLDYIAAATFFEEFTELVEYLSVLKEDFVMSGDVNFHLETTDSHVLTLKNLFDSFDLCQHVLLQHIEKGTLLTLF